MWMVYHMDYLLHIINILISVVLYIQVQIQDISNILGYTYGGSTLISYL